MFLYQKLKSMTHFRRPNFLYLDTLLPIDLNCNGGGNLLYIREHIPSKFIEINRLVECVFIELIL